MGLMQKDNSGASASPSGSRASHEAPTGLHPSGFDPSREMVVRVSRALRKACLIEFGANWNNDVAFRFALAAIEAMREPTEAMEKAYIAYAKDRLKHCNSPTVPGGWSTMIDAALAQGTEARRAETATKIGGSVHDGPVGEADAP